jgi:dTDP-4-amino-4,6-dideoxygalactose transaminase
MDVLPFALPDISRAEVAAVTECLESGWLTSGRKVVEFEAAFARRADRTTRSNAEQTLRFRCKHFCFEYNAC